MMKLKQRCYKFSVKIINFIGHISDKKIYFSVIDQLIRSSTSVGANIIEARASSSKKDFIRFYEIALKSSNETGYWISLIKDTFLQNNERISELLRENEEISKIIAASILTMKHNL